MNKSMSLKYELSSERDQIVLDLYLLVLAGIRRLAVQIKAIGTGDLLPLEGSARIFRSRGPVTPDFCKG